MGRGCTRLGISKCTRLIMAPMLCIALAAMLQDSTEGFVVCFRNGVFPIMLLSFYARNGWH
jgi:hypothetical protein